MATETRPWAVGPNVVSDPTFDVVVRGYHRREVDAYTRLVEHQLTAMLTETQDAQAQIRVLHEQLLSTQNELAELRNWKIVDTEAPMLRQLGGRVAQILMLADAESAEVRGLAQQEFDVALTEAARIVSEAQAHATRVREDFEIALSARRDETNRELAAQRATCDAETSRLEQLAASMRAEAEAELTAAREEAAHVTRTASEAAQQTRTQAAVEVKNLWAKTESSAAALATDASAYAAQLRVAADEQANRTREAAERHAQTVRDGAAQAAAELIANAETVAAEIRLGGERHADRLRQSGLARQAAGRVDGRADTEDE